MEIRTEKQRNDAVRKLRFCYLCGDELGKKKDWTLDHVPPTAFLTGRKAAMPMRAHRQCNGAWSVRDERAGQLASTMIGRYPQTSEGTRIDVTRFHFRTGESLMGVEDFDLERDVRRVVRAFHAALYNDYLPDDGIHVSLPFRTGYMSPTGPILEPEPRWHRLAVLDIVKSRIAKAVDRIVCHGDECEYICTWIPNQGRCVFGFRLHAWQKLGDPAHGERGCVGHYKHDVPVGANCVPKVAFRLNPTSPLDPFA